jgi:FkbM family methyltransferase
MQGSFEDAVQTVAISLAVQDGLDPHEQISVHPNDLRLPIDIAMAGLTARRDPAEAVTVRTSRWKQYRFKAAMSLLGQKNGDYAALADRLLNASVQYKSHVGQDAWVAGIFNQRAGGYFLDFGAFDGEQISNTYYLEKQLGWRGICVEPNPTFYPVLCSKRSAICVNAALYKNSREVLSFVDAHGLSSFEYLAKADQNSEKREAATKATISVDTINPTELLDRFKAPTTIDYMSLDVEGAEFDVLNAFDFNKYRVVLLTVEHNSVEPKRQQIRDYLAGFGYAVEGHRNDDFFWLKDFGFPNDPEKVLARVAETYKIGSA